MGVGSPQGMAAPQLRFIPWNALGQPLLGGPGKVRLCQAWAPASRTAASATCSEFRRSVWWGGRHQQRLFSRCWRWRVLGNRTLISSLHYICLGCSSGCHNSLPQTQCRTAFFRSDQLKEHVGGSAGGASLTPTQSWGIDHSSWMCSLLPLIRTFRFGDGWANVKSKIIQVHLWIFPTRQTRIWQWGSAAPLMSWSWSKKAAIKSMWLHCHPNPLGSSCLVNI